MMALHKGIPCELGLLSSLRVPAPFSFHAASAAILLQLGFVSIFDQRLSS